MSGFSLVRYVGWRNAVGGAPITCDHSEWVREIGIALICAAVAWCEGRSANDSPTPRGVNWRMTYWKRPIGVIDGWPTGVAPEAFEAMARDDAEGTKP